MAPTQLSFDQIKGNVVSVKDKGALGAGTDDSVAIQAAIVSSSDVRAYYDDAGGYKAL